MRPNERPGIDYYFVTSEEFERKLERGDFVEWAEVHGNRYGTEKAVVDKALRKNSHLLFSIDVQGAMNLKKLYGDRVLLIFIHPPSMEELKKRLLARNEDSSSTIERRLQHAYNELAWSKRFAHQITNDNLNRAYEELRDLVVKECL